MRILVREYRDADLEDTRAIWNTVVAEGNAFPQLEPLTPGEAAAFWAQQSYVGVAQEEATGQVVGMYILHPNNIGRCGHIANASYAAKAGQRGKGVGEALVRHSLATAAALGFKVMQFNAVVATNAGAIHLYQKLGFTRLGTIPGGFRLDDGSYADIILFYIPLE